MRTRALPLSPAAIGAALCGGLLLAAVPAAADGVAPDDREKLPARELAPRASPAEHDARGGYPAFSGPRALPGQAAPALAIPTSFAGDDDDEKKPAAPPPAGPIEGAPAPAEGEGAAPTDDDERPAKAPGEAPRAPGEPPAAAPGGEEGEAAPDADDEALAKRERYLSEAGRPPVILTLRKALYLALDNNVDIRIARVDAAAAETSIPIAEAAFDPLLTASVLEGQNRAAFFSNNPFSGLPPGLQAAQSTFLNTSTALTKRFITGTEVSAGLVTTRNRTENVFSLQPEYRTAVEVTLRQPLLRGFGIDANTVDIDLARLEAESARERLHQQLLDSLWEVELAYWDLVFALEDLRVRQVALERAEKLLDRNRKFFEAGILEKVQVYVAEAGVAQRKEAIILARATIKAARDRLVRLMIPSTDPRQWDVDLVPIDGVPDVLQAEDPDVVGAVRVGLERRPEARLARVDIRARGRSLDRADNELLPQLDLTGSWRQTGLGGHPDSSFDAVGSGRFYDFSFGVELQLPLFLRAERARLRRAELDVQSAKHRLAASEYLIIEDIRRAAREITTTRERIEASTSSLEATQKQLEQIEAFRRVGVATAFEELELQEQLAEAELSAIRAHIDHHIAIMGLERTKASFLDYYGVTLK